MVIEVAKRHPEGIRTLILEDGSFDMPIPETEEGRKAAGSLRDLRTKVKDQLQAGNNSKAAQTLTDTLNGPGAWDKMPNDLRDIVLMNVHTYGADAGRPVMTCDDFMKFDFPVMLMTGEKSPKRFEFFYGEMRKCRSFPASVVIPSAAHGMHRQNPKAFNRCGNYFSVIRPSTPVRTVPIRRM